MTAMQIPRLHIDDTILIVVDVQKSLMPTLVEPERLVTNCAVLLRMAELFRMHAIVTEQYPKGLGSTVEEVRSAIPAGTPVIEKTRFSGAVAEVVHIMNRHRRHTALICGIEAHICVLQTVLDLQAMGRQCFVASDAITAGQADQIEPAFDRMRRSGAIVSGVLSSMYELMGDSTHPAFRHCLELAKAVDKGK